jgi:hypothetical protein
MKPVSLFGAAPLLTYIAVAAVSVYGFGQYEPAWGYGGSLQVEAWLGVVGALIAMGSFGISSAVLRRVQTPMASFVLGATCAAVCILLYWLVNVFTPYASAYLAFLLLVAVSMLASLTGYRVAG